ncbi:hypothetical protein FSP39_025339 [Pinctada imbricata]|uniref:Tyr recombinase domain-containing protein n=1 Tax=Pinctada imbricata TaxID=66713 RepID=A0AA88Y6I1_PINIB|nr:hypothetical protein FSP39_025339 [Pinctada imbricata]
MSGLSKSVGLSKSYTNHSIRATGATILSKGMYGPAHVMAVTGHKSVQSLSVYQRLSNDEKIQMAYTLFKNIVPVSKNVLPALPSTEQLGSIMPPAGSENVMAPALPSTERPAIMPPSTSDSLLTQELSGVNMEEIFCDFENVSVQVHQVQSRSINIMRNSTHSTQPIFHNCTVNINILTLSHL